MEQGLFDIKSKRNKYWNTFMNQEYKAKPTLLGYAFETIMKGKADMAKRKKYKLNIEILKLLLVEKHIRQVELSRVSGIPRNSISRYLKGTFNPTVQKLALIADALGVSVEQLIVKEDVDEDQPSQKQKQLCFCPFCGENLRAI